MGMGEKTHPAVIKKIEGLIMKEQILKEYYDKRDKIEKLKKSQEVLKDMLVKYSKFKNGDLVAVRDFRLPKKGIITSVYVKENRNGEIEPHYRIAKMKKDGTAHATATCTYKYVSESQLEKLKKDCESLEKNPI